MEVEVKAKVDDLNGYREKLKEMGVVFGGPGFEKKINGPGDFIVRIRDHDGKYTLTSKTLTEVLGVWDEYETGIENPESVEKMLLLFGFVNAFNITKTREKGHLEGFEIILDDVKELGKFIEIAQETDNKEGNEEIRKRIIGLFSELGLSEDSLEKRGYGEILGAQMGVKFGGMR
jgi:predicted adenylyl cyclase CyaB